MKKRETKNGKKTEVILSEATDGVNRVRLIGSARAGEEECPWEEIDAYSGRFIVSGQRYEKSGDTSENFHPWIAYSTDGGKKWTPSTTTSNASQEHGWVRALAYGGGRFVMAGFRYDGTGTAPENYQPWIAYSTDGGKTWTPSDTTSDEAQEHGRLRAIAYGGGRFVVTGFRYGVSGDDSDNFHPWIAYSTDGGKTWTPSDTTYGTVLRPGQTRGLAYGGGRFVVAGYRYDDSERYRPWLAYSTDGGKTWTPSDTTSAGGTAKVGQLRDLAYGDGRFVVVGFNVGVVESDGDTDTRRHWLAYSNDGGKTWTAGDTPSLENKDQGNLYGVTYGDGRFVAAGFSFDGGSTNPENYHPWILYSTDGGATWTASDIITDEDQAHGQLRTIAYGGGRFVVGGFRYDGTNTAPENYQPWIAYSTDGGETWTPSDTTSDEAQEHGRIAAFAYAPDSYCWKFGKEEEEMET